ncbi:DUF2293 domain-containing protein [Actinoplanes sp. NPDC023714]|uniref:DUF2293 domain-containing protein n=1 Tax=Actinoplanes sp. NPDC023714 TaxID=3154322 RepID=UPI0033EF7F1E
MTKLERRVVTAAEQTLAKRRSVGPLDVLTAMGWLPPGLLTDWRQGRAPHLEAIAAVSPDRLADALEIFHRWVRAENLNPVEIDYVAAARDRHPLRFTASGSPALERAYRTNWTGSGLTDAQLTRLNKPPDLVVMLQDSTCTGCGQVTGMQVVESGGPICLFCADMDHLVFLPAGDAALTRRAKKASRLSAVVVRFNRSRRRDERRGLLVERAALERAEQECLTDEEARARRRERDRERRSAADEVFQVKLAEEIGRLFPGCPPDRAVEISRHASVRGSGRVGRSAAGQALDPDAVTRAVVALIRHEDTPYDDLLMSGVARDEARERIRAAIDRKLAEWRVCA